MRLRRLLVSPALVTNIIRNGVSAAEPAERMPNDLRIVSCAWENDQIALYIESERFDLVDDGHSPPDWNLIFRRVETPR